MALLYFVETAMSPQSQPQVIIRPAKPDDSAVCGQICHDAFLKINSAHGFASDFQGPDASIRLLSMLFSRSDIFSVVAEVQGRLVGSNALDERSVIGGIGPITVDPEVQNLGVGRKLMDAVINRSHTRGAVGLRLVQAAFHNRSMALYTNLGFDIREPLSCLRGSCSEREIASVAVRAATLADVEQCNALSHRVHGFERGIELSQAIEQGAARVAERAGRITGYSTSVSFFGHTVAETNIDMKAFIADVDAVPPPGILVPSRNSDLLRWCLANGLRIVQPMTLMTMGLYNEPAGAWMPSVLF